MNEVINQFSEDQAREAFQRCCAASAWVEGMLRHRPFGSTEAVEAIADGLWWRLNPADWREAFAGHPKIGADIEHLRAKFQSTAGWSAVEQKEVAGASDKVLHRLAEGNRAYEARFGYIFIVCATGKTAPEMLALLTQRMQNTPEEELFIAAEQQRQITRLRLAKL